MGWTGCVPCLKYENMFPVTKSLESQQGRITNLHFNKQKANFQPWLPLLPNRSYEGFDGIDKHHIANYTKKRYTYICIVHVNIYIYIYIHIYIYGTGLAPRARWVCRLWSSCKRPLPPCGPAGGFRLGPRLQESYPGRRAAPPPQVGGDTIGGGWPLADRNHIYNIHYTEIPLHLWGGFGLGEVDII